MIKNRSLLFVVVLISISAGIVFQACENEKKSFTEDEYRAIDSIYRIRVKEYKSKLDTLCDSVYQSEFPVMIDSIKEVRKREILDLINN